MELKDIAHKCMDSQGFILMAGYLTDEQDAEGHHIIQFQYRRHHFSLKDAQEAHRQLGVYIAKELMEEQHPQPPEEEVPAG